MTPRNLQNSSATPFNQQSDRLKGYSPAEGYKPRTAKPKGKSVFKVLLGVILLLIAVYFLSKAYFFMRFVYDRTGLTPSAVVQLLADAGVPLTQTDGRTNILMLGIGGDGHTGKDLTDTMIILSLRGSDDLALITLPRDLWSDTLRDKINTAYHYGEEKKSGGGLTLAKLITGEVTGLTIHYAAVLDFDGFRDIIDVIGGVDVMVPDAFTDPQFPVPGKETDTCDGDPALACRYEEVHFDAGLQHMDGARALSYVRSRHSGGNEGTDFARGRRQQEVLLAMKEKVTKPEFWTDAARVQKVIGILEKTVLSDMNIAELATAGKAVSSINQEKIVRISIEDELTVAPKWQYDGRYVLVPARSVPDLQDFILNQLH